MRRYFSVNALAVAMFSDDDGEIITSANLNGNNVMVGWADAPRPAPPAPAKSSRFRFATTPPLPYPADAW